MDNTYTCALCGRDFAGWGNNPQPLAEGRCCDVCNLSKVIPARLALHEGEKWGEVKTANGPVKTYIPDGDDDLAAEGRA
jgi:hypothetical protein